MWRLALVALPVAALILARALGGGPSQADTPAPSVEPSASSSPSPSPSPQPTTEPLTPSPSPPASPPPAVPAGPATATLDPAYPGSLRPGDWVRVTNTDSCLNVRWEPGPPVLPPGAQPYDNILNCLPDGFVGRLESTIWADKTSLPVNTDGRWWWHLAGQGWAADEWLTLHHQGGIPWPERPDLGGSGLIAYIGTDNGIWLMDADGTDRRFVVGADPNQWVLPAQWSPQGDRLAFSLGRPDGTQTTRVIDLNGSILMDIPGLSDPRWSPNGRHLSGVRFIWGGMGGIVATPVVFDTANASEWTVGPATNSYQSLAWSPDGSSLAFVCTSGYIGQPDGTVVIDEGRNCYGDGLRIVSVDGSNARVLIPTGTQSGYISEPSWSPSGQTIAVTSMQAQGGCSGYAVVDVASAAVTSCLSPPSVSSLRGGGCGGPGMSASTWTADGRLVYSVPGAGQSGVFVHDPATGVQTFIPNMSAGKVSLSSDSGHLAFAGGGYIWVAGLDGSNLTLLAEGHSAAWQPQP